MPDIDLDRLDELYAAATPGEWSAWLPPINGGEDNPDCQFIAAVHNAYPALIALARRTLAAEAELSRLRGLLVDYEKTIGSQRSMYRDSERHERLERVNAEARRIAQEVRHDAE